MMNSGQTHKVAAGIITVSLGLAAVAASAQETGSRQAREFVQAAASSGQFEILAADCALTQSTDPEVRAFAARMLQDHRQLGQALSDAANRSGLKPPDMAMSADQGQLLGALQSVSGKEFDALYFKQQALAHRSALVTLQLYAKLGDDSNLQHWTADAVPLISSHAEMATQAAMEHDGQ